MCKFCRHISNAGINRFKKHLASIRGDAAPCKKVPDLVKKEILEYIEAEKSKKVTKKKDITELKLGVHIFYDNIETEEEDDEEGEEEVAMVGTQSSKTKRAFVSKKARTRGLIDSFFTPSPETVIEKGNQGDSVYCSVVLPCGHSFNTARLNSFHTMLEAIGQFGPGLKAPTPYKIGELLMKKEVEYTNEYLETHKERWAKFGFSLMTDMWSDRRRRSNINLLVNCPTGTVFLHSIDASNDVHDAHYICSFIDKDIEEIGEELVIQVVTDNATPNLAAGHLLRQKRPHIFWTACAAHCVDLMLKAIGELPPIKGIIFKAKEVTIFIYSHILTLSMMRKCTKKRELVRPGVTRFTTAYLSLQSMYKRRIALRCKWSRDAKRKKTRDIILSKYFWHGVKHAILVFLPLVKVLHLVDADKPSMGFIYDAMERVKNEIAENLGNDATKYAPIWEITDDKWDRQLHRPLHAAGYYLNLKFFYADVDIDSKGVIMDDSNECLETLVPDPNIQDKISTEELISYKCSLMSFGKYIALSQRNKDEPRNILLAYVLLFYKISIYNFLSSFDNVKYLN
ncbi:hypothetical protein AMTRI_Chr08g162900 [Amborella trichopoda]